MRPWVGPASIGLLVAALTALVAVSIVQARALSVERERSAMLVAQTEQLSDEVAELRDEVDTLADQLEADRAAIEGPGGPSQDDGSSADPDGVGGDPADVLGGLLEGLLGGPSGDGEDDLGGLLDGLLGGLFGAEGQEDGNDPLGGLFGAGSAPGARCLVPGDGAGGMLGGLLGGVGPEAGADQADDDPDALIRTIADEVAELRELEWQEDVEVAFLDDAAIRARLQELLSDEDAIDRDALRLQERLLTALRAIPPGTDLEEVQTALLEDSVAGFYVSDTGELVVRVPEDGRIRGIDRITIAHELTHALADQTLGLPDAREQPLVDDADATLAALAVVEGDATLVMQRWGLEHVSLLEQLGALGDPDLLVAQQALDDVPHVLQRELLSPYLDGLDWVCDRYLEGGWAAVDAAYAEPPATTAEVLFGEPIEPATPASPGTPRGFESLGSTTFGAAPLLWLFEAPGGDVDRALSEPAERAAAWGGGEVEVWERGADTAVGMTLVDRGREAGGLCDSIGDFFAAAAAETRELEAEAGRVWQGPDDAAVLRCDRDEVVLGIGPDLATATTIAAR
jgi:hypothetical protein